MRIAICTNFVSPYRRPVFREIAAQTGAEVRVFVSTEMESYRGWAITSHEGEPFTVERVPGFSRSWTKRSSGAAAFEQRLERHYPIGLARVLSGFSPDVVISGELGPRTIAATLYGSITGTPVIPWAYPSRAQAIRSRAAALIQRALIGSAPCVIGMGSQARSVLMDLGATGDQIVEAPNAADTATIESRLTSPAHVEAVSAIRREHAGRRIAVVVGRLVPMKGIEELVDAWNAIEPSIREAWRLVFVGDGPLRPLIEQRSDESVRVVGHVEPTEIPDWFAAADLHVFASLGDPWGLVVNEAMQCGTPTLCSTLAGCCDDLVKHGVNGLVFTPGTGTVETVLSLREALVRTDLGRLGSTARNDIESITPATMAGGMTQAVNLAIRRATVAGGRSRRAFA